MYEAERPCAKNIGLKDIALSRRGELLSRRELIMYHSTCVRPSLCVPKILVSKISPEPAGGTNFSGGTNVLQNTRVALPFERYFLLYM